MKYFPNPIEMRQDKLQGLLRLNRSTDFTWFLNVLDECNDIIHDELIDESVRGNPNTIFRHIGALALIDEARQFMAEVENLVKL
jgi:hypothetical protein